MFCRKVAVHSRPLMTVLIGMCLGITLSLVFAPFSDEESCALENIRRVEELEAKSRASRKTKALDGEIDFEYWPGADYEPRIRKKADSPGKLPKEKVIMSQRNIIRPRYISTELGVKEKLFVGVLTSRETIETLGVAVNKTLTHYVPKVVFFMDNRGPTLPGGMSVVSFTDEKPNLKPFHMLKYIGDHYLNAYDWYLFLPDSTYMRGEKVFDMVNQISVSQELHMGKTTTHDRNHCDLAAGIIVSRNALTAIVENLPWCIKSASSNDASENVGKCFFHATHLPCMQQVNGQNFTHYSIADFDFEKEQDSVRWQVEFNKAVSVHTVTTDVSMYKMHRYFCELEMNQTLIELEKTKENFLNVAPFTPDPQHASTWPPGVDSPTKPKTRFDVIRWNYFTETHIYLDTEFTNMKLLTGADKEDIRDILKVSVNKLNDKYSNIFTYLRLVNGYRRFDPLRGMEYKLDLALREKPKNKEVVKRVNLVRPLSYVEMVPMPYVTENVRVNMVLPVTFNIREGVVSFLDSYAHTCLDSGDNANLFVVFIYDKLQYKNTREDDFAVLKSMISYYESKYMNGARIAWTAIQSSNPTQFTVMDAISKKFQPEALLLLCTVGMQLSIDFLNRVRMNTIYGWQVFFPIGFWSYKPNLIYNEKPYPATLEVTQSSGHFDNMIYDHTSFYNSDYMMARKDMASSKSGLAVPDLYDMFLKHHDVHVFRAVEPALLLQYQDRVCSPTLEEDSYSRCLTSRSRGLASRSQLAMLIFEHQQKVDQGQMKVLKQQNREEPIKANMLHRKK